MTVSQATTMVRTRGNSNGFHLDSTHSSIRGKGRGAERSRGLNRRQVCLDLLLYPSMSTKCSIHTYKLIARKKWCTLVKQLTKEKQRRKSETQKTAVAIQLIHFRFIICLPGCLLIYCR